MDGVRNAGTSAGEYNSDPVRVTSQVETKPSPSGKAVTGEDRSGSVVSKKKIQSSMVVP